MNPRLFLGGVTVALALGIVLDAGLIESMQLYEARIMAKSIMARGVILILTAIGAALAELKR